MKKTATIFLLALLCGTTYAQPSDSLVVFFDAGPDLRLAATLDSATVGFRNRADLNLDGVPDLTLVPENTMDESEEIVTINVAEGDTLWRYAYQDVARALGSPDFRFQGFFTFHADGLRRAIFRSRDAVGIIAISSVFTNIGKNSAADPVVLPATGFSLLDLTDDGFAELVIKNSQTGSVQVWGSTAVATATEPEIELAPHRLLQNYPNPFRESTTIAYEVERPGPVSLAVYDLLGRRVRTLVEADQPVGAYQIRWDGRDAGGQPVASGLYFYRLRVGEAVSSKQAIRIQ